MVLFCMFFSDIVIDAFWKDWFCLLNKEAWDSCNQSGGETVYNAGATYLLIAFQ